MSKRDASYRKLVAFLLLVSFGGFGAHRFYLGGLRHSAVWMVSVTAFFFLIAYSVPAAAPTGFEPIGPLAMGIIGVPYQTPSFALDLLLIIPI